MFFANGYDDRRRIAMLSVFLFFVFFSFYIWLYYKPNHTSGWHQRSVGVGASDVENYPKDALQLDKNKSIVQIIDKRTAIPKQPGAIAALEKSEDFSPPNSVDNDEAETLKEIH